MLVIVVELKDAVGETFYKVSTTRSDKYDNTPELATTVSCLKPYNPKIVRAIKCKNPINIQNQIKQATEPYDASGYLIDPKYHKPASGAKNNCFTCDDIEGLLDSILSDSSRNVRVQIIALGTYRYRIEKVPGSDFTEDEADAYISNYNLVGKYLGDNVYEVKIREEFISSDLTLLKVCKTEFNTFVITSAQKALGTVVYSAPIPKSAVLGGLFNKLKKHLKIPQKQKLENLESNPVPVVDTVIRSLYQYNYYIYAEIMENEVVLNYSESIPRDNNYWVSTSLPKEEIIELLNKAPKFNTPTEAKDYVEEQLSNQKDTKTILVTAYVMAFFEQGLIRVGGTTNFETVEKTQKYSNGYVLKSKDMLVGRLNSIIESLEDIRVKEETDAYFYPYQSAPRILEEFDKD